MAKKVEPKIINRERMNKVAILMKVLKMRMRVMAFKKKANNWKK